MKKGHDKNASVLKYYSDQIFFLLLTLKNTSMHKLLILRKIASFIGDLDIDWIMKAGAATSSKLTLPSSSSFIFAPLALSQGRMDKQRKWKSKRERTKGER